MKRLLLSFALVGCSDPMTPGEAPGIAPEPAHEAPAAVAIEPDTIEAPEPDGETSSAVSLVVDVAGSEYVVLESAFDASDLDGPSTAFVLAPSEYIAIIGKPTDLELPAELAQGAALFGGRGERCESNLGAPIALVRAEIPYEIQQRFRGLDPATHGPTMTSAEVEAELWATFASSALLVAPVEARCEGSLFAVARGAEPAARFMAVDAEPAAGPDAVEALALFRERPRYESMAADYAEYVGTEASWDDDEEVFERVIRFFDDPSGRRVVVVGAISQQEGCGGLDSIWAAFAKDADGQLHEIVSGDFEEPPSAILDSDGDGVFELLHTFPTGTSLRRSDEDFPSVSTRAPSIDCPC
jgi:hypothetical protein